MHACSRIRSVLSSKFPLQHLLHADNNSIIQIHRVKVDIFSIIKDPRNFLPLIRILKDRALSASRNDVGTVGNDGVAESLELLLDSDGSTIAGDIGLNSDVLGVIGKG